MCLQVVSMFLTLQNELYLVTGDGSKHFNPIGLIAPVLVVAKVDIQSCWKFNLAWNDALPDDVSWAYTNWKDDMGSLSHLKILQKVLSTHLYDEASLQVSCDAFQKTYGD